MHESENDRMISVHLQGKLFSITVTQVYALTSNAEEADVEQFYEDVQDHSVIFDIASKYCISDSFC